MLTSAESPKTFETVFVEIRALGAWFTLTYAMAMRLNRVQPAVCRRVLAEALGDNEAQAILQRTGVAQLPAMLPSRPRDLSALSLELQPFVDLYRALQQVRPQDIALQLVRACIIESGLVSHAADQDESVEAQDHAVDDAEAALEAPLNVTSPPPVGFKATAAELQRGFDVAMQYFSCDGVLFEYSPQRVHFHITGCNWCKAMQNAGAPELISFICETDVRFMDHHPTHRLRRDTAIGLGHSHCDFLFVPKEEIGE